MDLNYFVQLVSHDFVSLKISFIKEYLSDITNDRYYRYMINNEIVANNRSVILGVRELEDDEIQQWCVEKTQFHLATLHFESPASLISGYQIRAYLSACYFLDKQGHWKANGLKVI